MKDELENARRQVAEYAMALDLLAGLSQSDSEKHAIDNIIDAFSALFSPEKIDYIPLDAEGRIKASSLHVSKRSKDPTHDSLAMFAGNFAWTALARGFYVKISHRGRPLGVVMIDEIAFQEYREQYLNLALSLSEVCGLAIANARKKEALHQAVDELEDTNTALRILLQKRDQDNLELQENIYSSYELLITPFLNKLKNRSGNKYQHILLDIIETNLQELVAPFAKKLSSPLMSLTSSEIQIATMIKQGLTNKEIAQTLNCSKRTIDTHRENIRKKLDLTNRKINLKTFLLNL